MHFAIVEVGSTNTRAYLYKAGKVSDLGRTFIAFKNHYKENKTIWEEDKETLFSFLKNIKQEKIYCFGTSIFRELDLETKESWLKEFKDKTGFEFHIVTSDMENEFTVYGAIANVR